MEMQTRLVNIVSAKPLPGFRVWCKFDDGASGTADFSDISRNPLYQRWQTCPGLFESVVIVGGSLRWDGDIDAGAEPTHRMIFGDCPVGPRLPYPKLVKATPMTGFAVECMFSDGAEGIADLSGWAKNDEFDLWSDGDRFMGGKGQKEGIKWGPYTYIPADCLYEMAAGGLSP